MGRKDLVELTGVPCNAVARILRAARKRGELPDRDRGSNKPDINLGFRSLALPSNLPTLDELKDRRRKEFVRIDKAEDARRVIPIDITLDGPICICHMGDPHVDDPGSDFPSLERDVEIINATEGMWAATVGDLHNNWCHRLAHLHAEQETTSDEAWVLVEWLVRSTDWIYMVGGNHDAFSGNGDPLRWIQRLAHIGAAEYHGARMALQFPNGKEVRVNCRHDFSGTSQWNLAHSPMKAFTMGFKDHILTCGHRHGDAYGMCVDPESGLIGHALRTSGYKVHDSFAKRKGFVSHRIAPSVCTVIDPRYDDDDPRLVTVFWNTRQAADYLTWQRS